MVLFRRGPQPPGVDVVRRDPVFDIELEGAPPGEVGWVAGMRPGAFGSRPTEVWKVWRANTSMRLLVVDAVQQVRAHGGRMMSLACRESVDARFQGEKALPSGEIAALEVRGRGADVVATIWLRLSVGAFLRRVGEASGDPVGFSRLSGPCAPELIALLDEQGDRDQGT